MLNMAVLVVLSVGTGYVFSVGSTFFFGGVQFYEAVAVLLVFILLGHWLEMRARAGASDAIRALHGPRAADGDRHPRRARGRGPDRGGAGRRHRRDPAGQQDPGGRRGDRGRVAGRRVDAHRRVDAGGEEAAATRSIGATINKSGSFRYRATKVGADTALAQIVKLVQEAQNSKAPAQLLADRASQWLVLIADRHRACDLRGVVLVDRVSRCSSRVTLTITVFVIACPDALGLATPMAVMVGTGLGAHERHPVQERLRARGRHQARRDRLRQDRHAHHGPARGGRDRDGRRASPRMRCCRRPRRSSSGSDHPLAQAILERAEATSTSESADGLPNLDGMGARAEIGGETVLLGNRRLMDAREGRRSARWRRRPTRLQGDGPHGRPCGAGRAAILGLIAIADAPRPTRQGDGGQAARTRRRRWRC